MDKKPILELNNISKIYQEGAVVALESATLTINKGECVSIMGSSGSGKSTLLHLAGGLTAPDSGTVMIDGQNLYQMSDNRLTEFRRDKIGIVFQAFNLISSLSALDNVIMPLLLRGQGTDAIEKGRRLLDEMGLAERINSLPDKLSGGEQQRVAIARSLINNSEIIFADEPTGNLDTAHEHAICEKLQELNRNHGCTIVIATHEASVAFWTQRGYLLQDGRIIDEYTTDDFADATELGKYSLSHLTNAQKAAS